MEGANSEKEQPTALGAGQQVVAVPECAKMSPALMASRSRATKD